MTPERFGPFRPNWVSLSLAVLYSVFFLVYIVGYSKFNSSYHVLYSEEEYKSVQNMKWFLIGCPIVILLTTFALFVVSSFQSRQILLGVRIVTHYHSTLIFPGNIRIMLFITKQIDWHLVWPQFSGMLFLGGIGFVLIAAWLGSNLSRFNSEKGWESCTQEKCVTNKWSKKKPFNFGLWLLTLALWV